MTKYIERYGRDISEMMDVDVSLFGASEKCERNMVYPCLESAPQMAQYMVRYSECNCEDDPLDPLGLEELEDIVLSICTDCYDAIAKAPFSRCMGCGMVFRPAVRLFDDVVNL